MSTSAIKQIEELFLGAWAHTVTLEYMQGEDEVLITIESADGIVAKMSCDWAADEHLEMILVAAIHRAKRL